MGLLLKSLNSSVGRKFVMALSGLLLGVFLLIHLAGNSFMFWGSDAFNSYADRLHSLGAVIWIFDTGLLALFSIHVVTSAILFFENRRARPVRYERSRPLPTSNWAARSMPYTGVAILIFLFVHLSNFTFGADAEKESVLVRSILSQPLYSAYYLFSLLCLLLHVSHGFWSLIQTFGISHPRYDRAIRGGAVALAVLTGTVFIVIPVLFLLNRHFLV